MVELTIPPRVIVDMTDPDAIRHYLFGEPPRPPPPIVFVPMSPDHYASWMEQEEERLERRDRYDPRYGG